LNILLELTPLEVFVKCYKLRATKCTFVEHSSYKKVTREIIPEKCSTKGHFVAPILLHFTKTSRGDNSRKSSTKVYFVALSL
jgi:hypothetical protein